MIEKMELGEFYKKLRLARKLKQSDVACAGLKPLSCPSLN
ncbi:transcriptional regulator [Streptococcus pneumoniae]|nr:transcriptional regulator [Streptococcus pneumoniae]